MFVTIYEAVSGVTGVCLLPHTFKFIRFKTSRVVSS